MKNKYGNHKITYNDIKFDSKAEARRFIELKNMLASGEIKNLQLQPRFELQPSFRKHNYNFRKIEYIADFMYELQNGKVVVEDVKGIETEVFKLKRKIFEYKYPNLKLTIINERQKKL